MEHVRQLEEQLAQLTRQRAVLEAQLRVARRAAGVHKKPRRTTEKHVANAQAMLCNVPESLRYTIAQIARMLGIGERALHTRLNAASRLQLQQQLQQQQQQQQQPLSVETSGVTTPRTRQDHDLSA